MKREGQNILNRPELKVNPYSVPEGYFPSLKENMRLARRPESTATWKKTGIIISVAASVAIMILAGVGLMLRQNPAEYYDDIDLLVFSDLSEHIYLDAQSMSMEDLTDEDIIEYLIYTGVPVESIGSNE